MYLVAVERRRLPLPAGCPKPMQRLLHECWRHNAHLRPCFPEVLTRLRKLRQQDRLLHLPPALAMRKPSMAEVKFPLAPDATHGT